jgi:GAF domain-containing protein
MATTFCAEQVAALAERLKGEETSVLLAGWLTVTPARAGRERSVRAEQVRLSERSSFIRGSLLGDLKAWLGADSCPYLFSTGGAEYVFSM